MTDIKDTLDEIDAIGKALEKKLGKKKLGEMLDKLKKEGKI